MAGLQEYTSASLDSSIPACMPVLIVGTQMASKMAHSHGLGRESFFPGASEQERVMYRDTWAAITYLQQLTGSSSKLAFLAGIMLVT